MKKTILSIILVCMTFAFSYAKGSLSPQNEFAKQIADKKAVELSKKAPLSCTLQRLTLEEDCGNGETRTTVYVYCSEDPFNGTTVNDPRGECPIPQVPQN